MERYGTHGEKVIQLKFISTKSYVIYSDNDFVAILELPEGEHEYKFSIDGRWEYDLNEV